MRRLFLSVILYIMLEKTDTGALQSVNMNCSAAPDRGDNTSCRKPNAAIRFYHDAETDICFPFLYKGCGGNKNRYDTMMDCYKACPPDVMFHCLGKKKPTGYCGRDMKGCPPTSVCLLRSRGSGICCDMRDEELWLRDFRCHCPDHPWGEREWNNVEYLLGRKCEHEFCPAGFECWQGRYLAHCCQKDVIHLK